MYNYIFGHFGGKQSSESFVLDKHKSIKAYKSYMLSRLTKMFHYNNLPETLPKYMLEYYLMINGHCIVSQVDSQLFAFIGSIGGEPDVYQRPTLYIVANPALKLSKEYHLFNLDSTETTDCVFFKNDYLWIGLNPLLSRYATLLAENTITLRVADIMLRVVALISSPDDKTKAAADIYIKNIIDGKLSTMAENAFFDGVKMQSPPSNNGSYLTQFIELHQYLMGQFYAEIGIQSAFNMKREAINEAESRLSEDTLFPLIESMLEARQESVSRLNTVYNTNVSVEFDSVWRQNILEQALAVKALEVPGVDIKVEETNEESDEETNEESVEESSNGTVEENNEESDNETSQLTEAVEEVIEDRLEEIIQEEGGEEDGTDVAIEEVDTTE